MKKIVLHSPNVRNNGEYADAGTTLEIGDGPKQIDAGRAKAAVDGALAVSETAAKAEG